MEVRISKTIIVEDWERHPTAGDWWLRPIKHLDRGFPPDPMDHKQEVFVWIHRAKSYYAWEIQFTNLSGLKHLEVPLFREWELDAAKEYVDNIIKRVAKVSSFV